MWLSDLAGRAVGLHTTFVLDALSARDLGNGLIELGVHIADVSYFVKENSLTDLEARAR